MANAGEDRTAANNRTNEQRAWLQDGERASWFHRSIKQPVEKAYQRYFIELVLREKPLPPSRDGRHVPLSAGREQDLVDERRGHGYISNSIRSSRYTLWDFLPKQIIFQATRLHNAFFICIGVPQTIPGLSTTGNYTTIIPLLFFILLTVVKEGYDDWCRHRHCFLDFAARQIRRVGRRAPRQDRQGDLEVVCIPTSPTRWSCRFQSD